MCRVFDHSKIVVCCKRIQYIGDDNAKHYFKVIHVLVTVEDLSQHFSILNITWYFQMLLLRAAKQNNYTKRVINKCLCVCVCVCYCAPLLVGASICVCECARWRDLHGNQISTGQAPWAWAQWAHYTLPTQGTYGSRSHLRI